MIFQHLVVLTLVCFSVRLCTFTLSEQEIEERLKLCSNCYYDLKAKILMC